MRPSRHCSVDQSRSQNAASLPGIAQFQQKTLLNFSFFSNLVFFPPGPLAMLNFLSLLNFLALLIFCHCSVFWHCSVFVFRPVLLPESLAIFSRRLHNLPHAPSCAFSWQCSVAQSLAQNSPLPVSACLVGAPSFVVGHNTHARNLATREKQKRAYDTAYSQAVTHPSTNAAQSCLTSVIGRELVFSTWYGRRHEQRFWVTSTFGPPAGKQRLHTECWQERVGGGPSGRLAK